MLAASRGRCEFPAPCVVPSPGSLSGLPEFLAVLLALSPVTYYLVEAPIQRVGRGLAGGWGVLRSLTARHLPAPEAATEGWPGPLLRDDDT
jgi:hypothetical protein